MHESLNLLKATSFELLSEEHNYNLKKAAGVLRAISHNLRQHLIKTIHENKRITVTAIYVKLRIEQSVASQHLAILRNAGVVNTEREGKSVYYSINAFRLLAINDFARDLLS